jgi:hypothetical protein
MRHGQQGWDTPASSGACPSFAVIEPVMEPVKANSPVTAAAAEDIQTGFETTVMMPHVANRYRAKDLGGKCMVGAPDISIVLAVLPVVVKGPGVLLLGAWRTEDGRRKTEDGRRKTEDGVAACGAHRG